MIDQNKNDSLITEIKKYLNKRKKLAYTWVNVVRKKLCCCGKENAYASKRRRLYEKGMKVLEESLDIRKVHTELRTLRFI
jgi:hypothetical protein